MRLQGSCLSYPFRADQRGTLATVSARQEIINQSISAIVQTRQGERVMMPDYGLPDFVFAVIDRGFAARVRYHIEQQIKKYEPLVVRVNVSVGEMVNEVFVNNPVADDNHVIIHIQYIERGTNVPWNLVFPVRELLRG